MSHTPRHLTLFVANFETDFLDSVGQDAVTRMSAYKSHKKIMVSFLSLWNTVVWNCCNLCVARWALYQSCVRMSVAVLRTIHCMSDFALLAALI
jgi:hypothetical protein